MCKLIDQVVFLSLYKSRYLIDDVFNDSVLFKSSFQ